MDDRLLSEFLAEADYLIEELYGDVAALRARRGEGRERRAPPSPAPAPPPRRGTKGDKKTPPPPMSRAHSARTSDSDCARPSRRARAHTSSKPTSVWRLSTSSTDA